MTRPDATVCRAPRGRFGRSGLAASGTQRCAADQGRTAIHPRGRFGFPSRGVRMQLRHDGRLEVSVLRDAAAFGALEEE